MVHCNDTSSASPTLHSLPEGVQRNIIDLVPLVVDKAALISTCTAMRNAAGDSLSLSKRLRPGPESCTPKRLYSELKEQENVDLSNREDLVDEDLKLLSTFERIKTLNLSYCPQVTRQGLKYLPATIEALNVAFSSISSISALEGVPFRQKLELLDHTNGVQYFPGYLTSPEVKSEFPALRTVLNGGARADVDWAFVDVGGFCHHPRGATRDCTKQLYRYPANTPFEA